MRMVVPSWKGMKSLPFSAVYPVPKQCSAWKALNELFVKWKKNQKQPQKTIALVISISSSCSFLSNILKTFNLFAKIVHDRGKYTETEVSEKSAGM